MIPRRLYEFMITSSCTSGTLARCRVRGRTLSDPENIRLDIVPECAKKVKIASIPKNRDNVVKKVVEQVIYYCPTGCGYGSNNRSNVRRHFNNGSCWYQTNRAFQWEIICFQVASILLEGKNWKRKASIDVSTITKVQKSIEPEIVVFDENGEVELIIDAKTSISGLKTKDIEIYPLVAKNVEFWILTSLTPSMKERLVQKYKKVNGSFLDSKDLLLKLKQLLNSEPASSNRRRDIEDTIKKIGEFFDLIISREPEYYCSKCGRNDFKTNNDVKKHVKNCDGTLKCSRCDKRGFESKDTYDDHAWIHENVAECQYCGKNNFQYRREFRDHVWVHENDAACPHCGRTEFESKRTYDDHVWAHENGEKCPYCDKSGFESKRSYDDHVWVHENDATCPHCGKIDFQYKRHFDSHVFACKNKLKCPHCNKSGFKSRDSYNDHVWVHKNDTTCPHCKKKDFEYRSSFYRHVKKCATTIRE